MQELPEDQRSDAVSSMVYEANARVRDPVYGCVGAISSLQQQIDVLQTQLAISQAEVVHMKYIENNITVKIIFVLVFTSMALFLFFSIIITKSYGII